MRIGIGLIRDRNIVCIASNWFEVPTSKHHVMRVLSRQNHVLWVNFHASRRPSVSARDGRLILHRLRQVWSGARRVSGTLDVLSPLVIPFPESGVARYFNTRALARQIRAALRHLPRRPTQLWLFTPDVPELVDLVPAERVVYYCVDDFAAFEGFNSRLIEKLERRTMAGSDVVVTTSAVLHEGRAQQHANTHLLTHGVDFDHFAQATSMDASAIPAELRHLPGPVLGFFGLVGEYVDLDLIAAAARRRRDWSFAFIGETRGDLTAIADSPNVHLLGPRDYTQLPAYCRGFDVGLIPFRMNRLTRAVNPIKMREYLAAGLPVVSAPMPAVQAYAPAVRTAETVDEFVSACSTCLAERGVSQQAACQALVRSESWSARVEQLSEIVMAE